MTKKFFMRTIYRLGKEKVSDATLKLTIIRPSWFVLVPDYCIITPRIAEKDKLTDKMDIIFEALCPLYDACSEFSVLAG